jgi:hypothetical protein
MALMQEIVVKQPPPPPKLRPTQRPASAVHARSPAAASGASSGEHRPTSAGNGGPRGAVPTGTLRRSRRPPDGSRFPQPSGFFSRLTDQELTDRHDGIGGTTLPGAQALQEYARRHAVAEEMAHVERNVTKRAQVAANRAAAAQSSRMPTSMQGKFAWGTERIASSLLTKMDQFSARQEDHTRKLLWTLGTDQNFKETGSKGALRVTPQNFPRMCDRFGISCDEAHARDVFRQVGLPADGCSVNTLTRQLINSDVKMATAVRDQARRVHGDAARPATAVRQHTPPPPHQPFKVASLPSTAWANYAAERGLSASAAMPGAGAPLRSASPPLKGTSG